MWHKMENEMFCFNVISMIEYEIVTFYIAIYCEIFLF